jgi:hypothetical protein
MRTKHNRLIKLATYLEKLPKNGKLPNKKTFDLTYWSCETTACAVGYASTIPCLKRAGLELTSSLTNCSEPKYRDFTNMLAVAIFFNITVQQAEYLFFKTAYPKTRRGPRSVAKRIRQFVRTGKTGTKKYEE